MLELISLVEGERDQAVARHNQRSADRTEPATEEDPPHSPGEEGLRVGGPERE